MESIKDLFINYYKKEKGEHDEELQNINTDETHVLCQLTETRLKVKNDLLQKQVIEREKTSMELTEGPKFNLNEIDILQEHIRERSSLKGTASTLDSPLYQENVHPNTSTDDGLDLVKRSKVCRKNPDHNGFVPLKDLNDNCLHLHYDVNNLILQTIKILAALTVMVQTKFTSPRRPKFYPGSKEPYPYYNDRRSCGTRIGTGKVWEVNKYTERDGKGRCRCITCQVSAAPSLVWGEIRVDTANCVVFDDSEARHTTCVLGYDDIESPVVSLDGWEVCGAEIEGDFCELRHVTCNLEFINKLEKMCVRFNELSTEVNVKYRRFLSMEKLIVIVSHPHGNPKQVSIGKWTHKRDLDYGLTRYWYTAATCPGSAGAYVYRPGFRSLSDRHVHSGTKSGLNYSGGEL
ncbi:uncharacterized protein LOC131954689 [Physella acuta]|uniref:uncharacterized protein LOC131954689 n=1 Tax=Physella acuta TaxID=109671 RepID=UPI0027DB9ACE|nr:uncharacterized protein LOC131954689 [Physella acuta]